MSGQRRRSPGGITRVSCVAPKSPDWFCLNIKVKIHRRNLLRLARWIVDNTTRRRFAKRGYPVSKLDMAPGTPRLPSQEGGTHLNSEERLTRFGTGLTEERRSGLLIISQVSGIGLGITVGRSLLKESLLTDH